MERLTIGKTRGCSYNEISERRREASILFRVGCIAVCITLIIIMFNDRTEYSHDAAVPVMSTGVQFEQNNEMTKPETDATKTEEWSFYDYIGHLIADMLFGED